MIFATKNICLARYQRIHTSFSLSLHFLLLSFSYFFILCLGSVYGAQDPQSRDIDTVTSNQKIKDFDPESINEKFKVNEEEIKKDTKEVDNEGINNMFKDVDEKSINKMFKETDWDSFKVRLSFL